MSANLPAMVWERVVAQADRPILREKQRGIWRAITWAELGQRMRAIGQALRATGFEPGDVACVLAETRPEWVYADLGIQGAGGIAAGIPPTAGADGVGAILRDCAARVLFVENEEQLDKALHARQSRPTLERIIILDMKGLRDLADPMCESLEAFIARGEAHDRDAGRDWEQGLAALRPDSIAALTYTAGTTGTPKGVMLSHRAVLAQAENAARLFGLRSGDERLAFMPMSHVMERVLGLYAGLHAGTISNYVEGADTVLENLREVRPTVLVAAPHVWERFHARVRLAVEDATLIQRLLYRWAIAAGGRTSGWAAWEASLLRWLVLGNVRRELGLDRLRLGLVGGAPVSATLVRWFRALGIELTEIYGQTECAGLAAAGNKVPCGEIAFARDGEILVHGPHVFSGYWNQPQETARVLRDGWLHTGDFGAMTNGALRVAGRRTDSVTLRSGQSISAAEVERELRVSPYVSNALLSAQGQEFLSCLVMIDHDAVERWAQANRVPFTSFATLVCTDGVRALIGREIESALARLGRPGLIGSFRLIEHKLEREDPELTPLMQLRRGLVGQIHNAPVERVQDGA
ncbi:MAG TPA: AMP-binding protein [Acetobacteraceae bacterium]|nr:AMP-binding protein [Acetobacteraceae bacterium]